MADSSPSSSASGSSSQTGAAPAQADAPAEKPASSRTGSQGRRRSDGSLAAATSAGAAERDAESAQSVSPELRLLSAPPAGATQAAPSGLTLSWRSAVIGASSVVLVVGALATFSFCSHVPDVQAMPLERSPLQTPAPAVVDPLIAGPSQAESALVAAALSDADKLRRQVQELQGVQSKLTQAEADNHRLKALLSTPAPREPLPATSGGAGSANAQKEHYDLVIVVPSHARELERRSAVRGSWMNYLTSPTCKRCRESKVRIVFIVGNEGDVAASRAEAAKHGDMAVLEDFGQAKHYTLRSEKTFRCLRYAVQHYTFRLLMKADTDSWVFLDRLLRLFDQQHLWDKEHLYAGNFREGRGAKPDSRKDYKWYDPVYYPATHMTYYPEHAKGAGYVLGRKLAEALASVAVENWQFLPSEDVGTGFMAFPFKKEIVDIPVSIAASCADGEVVDHYVTPETMKSRWSTYQSLGTPCFHHAAYASQSYNRPTRWQPNHGLPDRRRGYR